MGSSTRGTRLALATAGFLLCLGGGASVAASIPPGIAFTRADGALVVERGDGVSRLAARAQAPAWSPDGRRLAYVAPGPGGQTDVHVVDADGTHRGRLTRTAPNEVALDWSPDGRRLVVERAGRLFIIYLGDPAGGGPFWSIPASGGAATPLGGPTATRFRPRRRCRPSCGRISTS